MSRKRSTLEPSCREGNTTATTKKPKGNDGQSPEDREDLDIMLRRLVPLADDWKPINKCKRDAEQLEWWTNRVIQYSDQLRFYNPSEDITPQVTYRGRTYSGREAVAKELIYKKQLLPADEFLAELDTSHGGLVGLVRYSFYKIPLKLATLAGYSQHNGSEYINTFLARKYAREVFSVIGSAVRTANDSAESTVHESRNVFSSYITPRQLREFIASVGLSATDDKLMVAQLHRDRLCIPIPIRKLGQGIEYAVKFGPRSDQDSNLVALLRQEEQFALEVSRLKSVLLSLREEMQRTHGITHQQIRMKLNAYMKAYKDTVNKLHTCSKIMNDIDRAASNIEFVSSIKDAISVLKTQNAKLPAADIRSVMTDAANACEETSQISQILSSNITEDGVTDEDCLRELDLLTAQDNTCSRMTALPVASSVSSNVTPVCEPLEPMLAAS